MATRMLRRGLPRVPGGEPWPPADAVAVVADAGPDAPGVPTDAVAATEVTANAAESVAEIAIGDVGLVAVAELPREASGEDARSGAGGSRSIRRGLPRVVGGEPWPPADAARASTPVIADVLPDVNPAAPQIAVATTAAATATATAAGVADAAGAGVVSGAGGRIRRGLPRTPGAEPWPPAGTLIAAEAGPGAGTGTGTVAESVEAAVPAATESATGRVLAPAGTAVDVSVPLPWTRTVWNGRAPRHLPEPATPARRRPTWTQAIAALLGAAALGILAGAAVALVRTLLSLEPLQDFLAAFPGQYAPAVQVEPGFAPWIGWQHFFNMFLMVLIIRSGLTIRNEKRPAAFWTPKNNAKGKVSLTIWFHQALDILWLVNGVIFVVLLFVTGHWARIVPTSWEVFPNALSAALQYVSFDWPHENGWNNYNSLQQLAYFVTVFLAAPLAAVTGFRMSGLWPKRAERLSKAYPIEWARAVHFPVMLYFVLFIVAHVALVFLTGFLANLNHMFASSDAVTWTGFWVFVASVVVIAGGWAAARPLVIAPIAKLFGTVSGR